MSNYSLVKIDGRWRILDGGSREIDYTEARDLIVELMESYPNRGYVYLLRGKEREEMVRELRLLADRIESLG